MNIQPLHDSNGNNSGMYIPHSEWKLIKQQYPDIDEITDDIPAWHKEILTSRLNAIIKNPERVKPIEMLFEVLKREIER